MGDLEDNLIGTSMNTQDENSTNNDNSQSKSLSRQGAFIDRKHKKQRKEQRCKHGNHEYR